MQTSSSEAVIVHNAQEPVLPVEPAASQVERPLNLTLRPGLVTRPSTRDEALSDPRANSRITPEVAMTQALGGDGRLVEQNLGNGRRRFWKNGSCLQSQPTRAAQLDPYPTQPRPNLIGDC